ncbi:MAG: hypothetical protein JW732_03825 [Dehalococcoidia bacterium]|nr:hypothetical protein [Dehalococcoidia bacterium]
MRLLSRDYLQRYEILHYAQNAMKAKNSREHNEASHNNRLVKVLRCV